MKVTTILYAAILACASVDAAAAPAAQPSADEVHAWCYRPGEPCTKMKRAAEAVAEAFAEAHAAANAEPGKTNSIPPLFPIPSWSVEKKKLT